MIEDVLSGSETSAEQIYMLPFEKNHIDTVLHKMAQEEAILVEEGKLVLNKKYNYDRN